MRKLAESTTRVNVRVPSGVAEWLAKKAKANGMTISDQMRHFIIDAKVAEDIIMQGMAQKGNAKK